MNVVFIVFNRPDMVSRVFPAIRAARPERLFLIGDAARPERVGEAEKVLKVRKMIETMIDWPCQVYRNYSQANMGCRDRVVSGLNWVFEHVEDAIILEDDCLPSGSFFMFCEELLNHYAHDTRVMHIGGDNFQRNTHKLSSSYYFSKYTHVWGWATWRRAWALYESQMTVWPHVAESRMLSAICDCKIELEYWSQIFDGASRGLGNAWSYAWLFTCWKNHGLSIVPSINLVSNLGVGPDATHFRHAPWYMNLPVEEMPFLIHPECVMADYVADRYTFDHVFRPTRWARWEKTILNPWYYSAQLRNVRRWLFRGLCR